MLSMNDFEIEFNQILLCEETSHRLAVTHERGKPFAKSPTCISIVTLAGCKASLMAALLTTPLDLQREQCSQGQKLVSDLFQHCQGSHSILPGTPPNVICHIIRPEPG